MAKWGQGDPRWIVEERADATNVNNWHWTEKNATPWSKDRIKSLLSDVKVEDDEGCCEIKEITNIDGEASANNRKAKLIFFYEWVIKADWSGYLKSDKETKYEGKVEVVNLSDENTAEDLDVVVTTTNSKEQAFRLKELMRTKGAAKIREQLGIYMKNLREEFSQGMILPSKTQTNTTAPNDQVTNKKNDAKVALSKPISSSSTVQSNDMGVKIPTKKLVTTETFQCEPAHVYSSLTEKEMVQAFTKESLSTFEPFKGGRFVLFEGNVSGEFTELIADEKIRMKWRSKDWPTEHYSQVTISLSPKDGGTELKLAQTGVPSSDYERTQEGWTRYYWHAIKQTFGFQPRLF